MIIRYNLSKYTFMWICILVLLLLLFYIKSNLIYLKKCDILGRYNIVIENRDVRLACDVKLIVWDCIDRRILFYYNVNNDRHHKDVYNIILSSPLIYKFADNTFAVILHSSIYKEIHIYNLCNDNGNLSLQYLKSIYEDVFCPDILDLPIFYGNGQVYFTYDLSTTPNHKSLFACIDFFNWDRIILRNITSYNSPIKWLSAQHFCIYFRSEIAPDIISKIFSIPKDVKVPRFYTYIYNVKKSSFTRVNISHISINDTYQLPNNTLFSHDIDKNEYSIYKYENKKFTKSKLNFKEFDLIDKMYINKNDTAKYLEYLTNSIYFESHPKTIEKFKNNLFSVLDNLKLPQIFNLIIYDYLY